MAAEAETKRGQTPPEGREGRATGPLPLRGEADRSDVGLGEELAGLGPTPAVAEDEEEIAVGDGLRGGAVAPGADLDPGTAGPGRTPDLEGGPETGATIGLDQDSELAGATDVGTAPGFAETTEDDTTAGRGSIPDRGTTAGIGTVGEGSRGGETQGLSGTSPAEKRPTRPLSRQATIVDSGRRSEDFEEDET